MIRTKEDRSNAYNKYFENYIHYKIKKIVSNIRWAIPNRKKDYSANFNIVMMRNNIQVIREHYFLGIISVAFFADV